MVTISSSLTVFFEEPFWVGVYERQSGNRLEVCKITFGAEPKDYEVYDFLLRNDHRLRFSPPVAQTAQSRKQNPKRMQRAIKKQLQSQGVGTKAQQALKAQHEQQKVLHKSRSREEKERQKLERFEQKQLKKKKNTGGTSFRCLAPAGKLFRAGFFYL